MPIPKRAFKAGARPRPASKMPIPKNGVTFEAALEGFRAAAESIVRAHFERNGYTFATPNVEIKRGGQKFIKLINTEETGEKRGLSVHSFVEIATGDIFKAASWKAPAKHARGNIYRDNGCESMTEVGGIKYLR